MDKISNNNGKITEGITITCNTPQRTVSFRVSEKEWEIMNALIEKSGLTKSEFIRRAIFGENIVVVDGGRDILVLLAECSKTLNSLKDILLDKNVSSERLSTTLNTIKTRQNELEFQFSDIEASISDLFFMVKGGSNDDSEINSN